MTAANGRRLGVVLAAVLLLPACGGTRGVGDTRHALEREGYRDVAVTVRSGGGIDVVRVDAAGDEPDRAARVVWTNLPVRFDQLVVALPPAGTSTYSYETLAQRLGPRDRSLDRKQVNEQVVRHGLDLMLVLTLGALLSVGGVVTLVWLVLRAARRGRSLPDDDQAEGPISGLGVDSPTPAEPAAEAEGPGAIPS